MDGFCSGKSHKNRWFRGTPILGNPHINIYQEFFTFVILYASSRLVISAEARLMSFDSSSMDLGLRLANSLCEAGLNMGVPAMGVPPKHSFSWDFLLKPSIVGYPHFWKTPNGCRNLDDLGFWENPLLHVPTRRNLTLGLPEFFFIN